MFKLDPDTFIYISKFVFYGDLTKNFMCLSKSINNQLAESHYIRNRRIKIQEKIMEICLYHARRFIKLDIFISPRNYIYLRDLEKIKLITNTESRCTKLICFLEDKRIVDENLTDSNIVPLILVLDNVLENLQRLKI